MTTYVLGMFDDHLRKVVTTPTFFFGSSDAQVVPFLSTTVWARFVGAVSVRQPDRVYIQLGDNELAKIHTPIVLEAYKKVVKEVLEICHHADIVLGQAFPRYPPEVQCMWNGPPFDWTRHQRARELFNRFLEQTFEWNRHQRAREQFNIFLEQMFEWNRHQRAREQFNRFLEQTFEWKRHQRAREQFNKFLEETFANYCSRLRILDSSFAVPRMTHRADGAQLNERGNAALVAVLNGMWDNALTRTLQEQQQENVLSRMTPGMCENSQPPATDIDPGKRKADTVGDGDALDGNLKKCKLEPLDHGDADLHSRKAAKAEETRVKIKTLMNTIPTARDELFAFPLDWRVVDQSLLEKRVRPWVNIKIAEYIGKKEPKLTDLVCQKVMAQSQPQTILNNVAMVFHSDEKAEAFVVKMWKLLIYETEAKKAGLVK